MAHRRNGHERLGFAASRTSGSSLYELSGLIDWHPITALLKPIHASAKGEAAWPPLAMFRALLLSVWCDLSDGGEDVGSLLLCMLPRPPGAASLADE